MSEAQELGLVNTRGHPLVTKGLNSTDHASRFRPMLIGEGGARLKGAKPNPRRNDYRLYLDMYYRHWLIKAAIDKKAMVATNTGWEFVPRSSRMREVPEDQANTVTDFFETQHDFLTQLRAAYVDLEIFGDGFLYVVPDRRRRPRRLKHIEPWTMHIKAKKNGEVQYYVQTVGNDTRTFKPHEIIHFRHVNPDDDLYGLSRLEAIKNTVISDLYAENYNLNFFKNGAATGTMFIIKNASTQELEMNRLWIRDEYVGSNNAHKPIILAGDVDVKKSVASHQDMGYLEGREANTQAILAALDVPPAKVGIMESANRSNSKEQDKSFRTEAVMPLQHLVEQGLSSFIRDVLGCPDVLFKHSEGDIRDAQEQMDLWEKAAKSGFMTTNEVRSRMGLPKIEGGDIPYVMTPTGAVPVVDLELYFKLAATNAEDIPPSMRTRHANVDPNMYGVGESPSKERTDTAVVEGRRPATKTFANDTDLTRVRGLLQKSHTDPNALLHGLSHVMDWADFTTDDDVHRALNALQKARQLKDDPELREVYISRALAALDVVQGVMDG